MDFADCSHNKHIHLQVVGVKRTCCFHTDSTDMKHLSLIYASALAAQHTQVAYAVMSIYTCAQACLRCSTVKSLHVKLHCGRSINEALVELVRGPEGSWNLPLTVYLGRTSWPHILSPRSPTGAVGTPTSTSPSATWSEEANCCVRPHWWVAAHTHIYTHAEMLEILK